MMARVVARNAFVVDPIWKIVRVLTGTLLVLLRTPKPLEYTSLSPTTIPMARPGTSNAFIPLAM
jgi:hypothetical protein